MSSRQPLQQQLCQLLTDTLSPTLRCTTPTTLAALAVGLTFAESVQLPAVADATGLPGSREALTLRFRRFRQHTQATRQVCWDPLLPTLLAHHAPAQPVLILDLTHHADQFISVSSPSSSPWPSVTAPCPLAGTSPLARRPGPRRFRRSWPSCSPGSPPLCPPTGPGRSRCWPTAGWPVRSSSTSASGWAGTGCSGWR